MASPPQLQLSLPPNATSFKRSFEQFGFDLDSPSTVSRATHEAIDGTSSSSTASAESSSTISPDGDENRRKRARSASSLSGPEDPSSETSSSTLSSFDSESSSTDQSTAAARRHLLLDLGLGRGLGSSVALGLSMASAELELSGRAISEPPPRIPTPELLEEDVDMPDIDIDFSRHEEEHEEEEEEEESASHAEHVRRSVDRFNAFDRHINVLRSSSPPVIPLPASLSSRQASRSPPTLPPLPLVDLGLDAEDEQDDDRENIPSTVATNTTTNTPPRLDLNLPSTTSLSSSPGPHLATEDTASAQFRERLDSAIDGLGGGDLQILPSTYSASPSEQRPDDTASFDRYFEPVRDSLDTAAPSGGNSSAHHHRLVESPLFEWPPSQLDYWNSAPGRRPRNAGSSSETPQSPHSPPYSWRPPVRPANATAVTDTTTTDIRRFIGSSYSPPPPPHFYPLPALPAAPLSVPATSGLDGPGLDVDLVGAYLDLHQNSTNRAWESALERARTTQREREQERMERERQGEREREREREHEREREREAEAEREEEHPWSLDTFWERAGGRPHSSWETLGGPAGLAPNERERALLGQAELYARDLDAESMRRTLQRRDRERQRDGQPERGPSSVSRAARYLESGLVDPREALRPAPDSSTPARERRLRPPSDTSNPFSVSWGPRRGTRPSDDDDAPARPRPRPSRSSSQTREGTLDWLAHLVPDESLNHFTLDDWISSSEARPSRSANPRAGPPASGTYDDRDEVDRSRRSGEASSGSGEVWRRNTGTWQPRHAVSPQSTAQPTRTAAHARAQSTSSISSFTGPPSYHRLRSRLYGAPRAAVIGSSTSLVAENAAAIRRREARAELLQRLTSMDVDALSDPGSDWESAISRRARDPPPVRDEDGDEDMDSDEEDPPLPRRVAEAIGLIGARPPPPRRMVRYRRPNDASPSRQGSPLPPRHSASSARPRARVGFEDVEEPPMASSSGLNTRRPLTIRRSIPRLRQHHISSEISPPPPASASVDRRHVSWEAPPRDTGVSSTYQYLSALSHGFDSQSLSISDLAQTIASNSNTEALRSPSPPWGEHESPFSTLFARTRGASSSSGRIAQNARNQEMPGGYPEDAGEAAEDLSVPSLPPPDLGGDFERTEDILRSASAEARASSAVPTPSSESPTTAHARSPPPPPPTVNNRYTGPFGHTMQRREEFRRLAAAGQRRVPDPPSIPPLHFGGDFDSPTAVTPPEERAASRLNWVDYLSSTRHLSYQGPSSHEFSSNARLAESERRLFNYRGPSQSSQGQSANGDPRRFFPSRPTATSSTSHVHREPEETRPHRYSATDMHNVLARQARLAGSRLASDLPSSPYPDDVDIRPEGLSQSRAQHLISRFHEQAAAEAREPSSSSRPWAALPLPRRTDAQRAEATLRRNRTATNRHDPEHDPPLHFYRHRPFREQSLHAMFGHRVRRRALGDYMRDEDFDASYETLLSLGGIIGDAKPKATPDHVVAGLENATYKEWATAESDQRCPICLDDYEPSDPVMKLGDCRHWLHKECLEQWLKGASTCPVCRKDVKGKAKRPAHHHPHVHHHRRRDGDGPGGGDVPPVNWLSFLRD